ncbi:RNA-directed DNA polymerase from mobile element jockey [Nymphon striatum]|nr:RNA-directed DNA polymerase from mobile element jockey [Nymphon striatum]
MAHKNPHPLKRTRSQSDIEFSNDKQKKINKNDITFNNPSIKNSSVNANATATATPWPRFLVIKAITENKSSPLLKLSPFAIFKTIISIAGDEPKSVKRLISGDTLVETKTKHQTDRLLKAKDFFNIPVTVSPHGSLNYSKGVIRSRELKDCSESELLTELSSQGVTAVKKILITRNGQKITTGTIILTFNIPEPPKSIKAAYLNVSVDKYIPNPLRCFKCQKFGHHQTSCKHEAVCGRCGETNHTDDGCEKTPCCWNCRGYRSKYDEICRLLNDHNPTAMCLQETRLNDTYNTTIRRYSIYRRDLPSEHPAGGVCIIVNNQIPHSSVQLNSSLQAIAVRVSMHKVLTICSIYIPPSSPIIAADVEDLLRQLPAPALICGDFNGHNLLWGSRVTNPRGRTIEDIILHNNLCLFNDTSMTYLDLSAGTYSALDLTLCHPSLLQDFTWMVDGDLHTSDHFPIHVKGNGPPIKGRPQRWKLHKADWTMFKQLCAEQLNILSFAEISDQYSEFITILLEVAEISIPKTSQYPKRFNKPWFNKDCKDAVRERKRVLRKFSLRPTSDNLSSYRQAAAAARRTIRQAKRESWRQYVSKLNSQSSIKSAWDRLRKIRGKGTSDAYKHLNVGGTAITSQFGIANALGQSFYNMKYSHPTICDILVKLHFLTESNHVIFCWLPSHVGISGNEKADFAAKSALSLPSKWDGEINNKLHAIKPKLGEWALAYRKSRKEESILCRLRVGHTYLTHSFLLRNEAQPVCGRCQQPLTVRHVLVDCVALTSVRSRFYSPLPWEEFFEEGLRLSLGAFRTTPAESLYVEAHEPSLYLRREKLSLQYACRLRANPENPCYDVTFHPNHRETFARRQNSIPTFGLRVLPLFEQIGLPLGNIARCVLPSIPPWTMHRPIINFSLTGLKKGTTPSYAYLYKFLEVSDSYHGYHHIYTDGSRQNDEVAAAAISTLTSLSSRLPDKSSIFSAESKALLLALDIVENSTYGRYIILSDSLSCLMALDNMKYSHPTICEILLKLHTLSSSNHVIFCWLPSHVGISGNEKADFAAKSALSLPVDHQFISYHDFYMYILKHILSIWQSKWDGEINNKLHAIKPKLGEWALACRKSRKEDHIGISGNEKADFAAKSALSLPVDLQSIYFHDFYMYILSIWQSKWDGEINNKLHAIKPKLGEWALAYSKSRKEESILCRLRVGHTYLTHSFLLRNEAQLVCGR